MNSIIKSKELLRINFTLEINTFFLNKKSRVRIEISKKGAFRRKSFMKKKIISLALSALMVTGLVGCGSNDSNSGNSGNSSETTLKVGMVTDSGTIDDI